MGKNILVLTGSPRSNGNSFMLADAFIKGAEEAGHRIQRFDAARKQIDGCRACNQCFKHGKACLFDDDFNSLAPILEEADVLVLATPLYWFSFPTQLKAALDKFYAFMAGGRPLKIKECALLVSADQRIASPRRSPQSRQKHLISPKTRFFIKKIKKKKRFRG